MKHTEKMLEIKKIIKNDENMVNQNNIKEQFTNIDEYEYKKLSETAVPIKKEKDVNPVLGNLEQCQEKCNLDNDCVGFVREKKSDETVAKCHIIKNVINCHNEHKKPSDKYILNDPKMEEELEVIPRDFLNMTPILSMILIALIIKIIYKNVLV